MEVRLRSRFNLHLNSFLSLYPSTIRNTDSQRVPLRVSSTPKFNVFSCLYALWCSLLGFSAFAGFGILLAVWPLNTFLTRRSVRIQKGQLAARDKRMGILSELIKAVSSPVSSSGRVYLIMRQVKFIKLLAWEEKWIGKTMDAREVEMRWLIKGMWMHANFASLLVDGFYI